MKGALRIFLYVLLLFAFILNFISATCTNSTYSGSGSWVINSTNSNNTCSNMIIVLNGNLEIQSGGNLTFTNVTLLVNTSTDRQYSISSSGSFYIYNSNFTALNQNYKIDINTGIFWVNNSTFKGNADSVGQIFMDLDTPASINFSLNNSHIGYGEVYYAFKVRPALALTQYGFIENTIFDGSDYDFWIGGNTVSFNPTIQMKNCTWTTTYLYYGSFACVDCNNFAVSLFLGTSAYYSKNHNDLINQTLIRGSFNYTDSLYDEFKTETNRTIQLTTSDTTINIPSEVNVTFDNVTILPSTIFSNSNSITIDGKMVINRTGMNITDIVIINPSNIITNGVSFLHKMYLNVRAYLNGVAYENINITGYAIQRNAIFTNMTNSTGYISRQTITRFLVNDSGLTEYFPFTINSSEILGGNYSRTTNLTSSSSINLPEDLCEFPSSGSWTISSNTICENRVVILTGNVNITSGYNLTLMNSTLNLSSETSADSYIYVGNNASLFLNKSILVGKDSTLGYNVHVIGSYTSNVSYLNSFIDKNTNNTFYVGYGTIKIENSTFLREINAIDGSSSSVDTIDCKFNLFTNDTISKQVTINRSIFYGTICFGGMVSGGQINLTVLDSDVYSFSFYANANLSRIMINNTLDLKVLDDDLDNDSSSTINITDDLGNVIYSGTADSNGELNSISLTHRLINVSSDVAKTYSLVANGKTFNLSMGIPRTKFNQRQVVIGTYNQNYEEKLSRVPYLYDFGFTIHDDADTFDVDNGNATYAGIYNAGFLTSASQWVWDDGWGNKGFHDYEDELEWMLDLKNKGFELAAHSATGSDDWRNETNLGFNNWSELIGFPMMYIEHSSNLEHLIKYGADPAKDYYLLDFVNTSNISYYWLFESYSGNAKWRTTPENSSTFYNGWKAYDPSIDSITGERWSYGEISLFPNYTNEKAMLPSVNNYGTSINLTSMIGKIHLRDAAHIPSTGLRQLYTPSHIFDLQETHDLTIVYTHSTSFSEFNHTLNEVAKYDGYFVPAGVLLDYSKKLEKVSIVGGDKSFIIANNGDSSIEGVVVYPDTNGTIVDIHYANTTTGLYLLSVGLDSDEMMLPTLSSGETLTVNYSIGRTYDSNIPKITNISNGNVELRNAVYNLSAKKTDFKIGLDRITTYNTTNTSVRFTNITFENLDSTKNYTIQRDGETWTNYSWNGNTLTIWTFLSEHNFTIQEKSSDGIACTYSSSCLGGYCNSGLCASSSPSSAEASASTSDTNRGSFTGTFKPSPESLEKGYSVNLGKNQKVEIPIEGETETVVVESIGADEVSISVGGESYDITEGGSIKIDSNSDGYYDTEVENIGISGNYVNLKFTLINEEIPKNEEEGKGSIVGEIIDEIPNVKEKWYVYAIMGVVVFGLIFYLIWNKYKMKKRYKKYGY